MSTLHFLRKYKDYQAENNLSFFQWKCNSFVCFSLHYTRTNKSTKSNEGNGIKVVYNNLFTYVGDCNKVTNTINLDTITFSYAQQRIICNLAFVIVVE